MKAVVYEKSNSPEVLVCREVEKPVPNDAEVLVKIHAGSINAADYRSMRLGIIPKRKIFGADIAGTVEAAGKSIKKFKVGDEVFGDISGCGFGGFAEYVAVPESALVLKPASVSFEDAAAVPMAAITALQGCGNKARFARAKGADIRRRWRSGYLCSSIRQVLWGGSNRRMQREKCGTYPLPGSGPGH